jgi:hypothetical protein
MIDSITLQMQTFFETAMRTMQPEQQPCKTSFQASPRTHIPQ